MTEPGPYIQTLSGRRVNPLDPTPEDIDPGDIGGALANICRFGGHSSAFYSVAQHSLIVCDLLAERGTGPEELMAALLHDAAEAYLGDLPHPIKHRSELGAAFRAAEARLEEAIAERFGLRDASGLIKPIDRALLAAERRIFCRESWAWPELEDVEPLAIEIDAWAPKRAAAEFARRYGELETARADALRREGPRTILPTVD